MLAGANVRPVITNKETEVEIAEDPDDKPPFLDRQVLLLTVNDNTLYSKARFKLRADPEEGLDYYYLAEKSQFGCSSCSNMVGSHFSRVRTKVGCSSCSNKVMSRFGLVQTRSAQLFFLFKRG